MKSLLFGSAKMNPKIEVIAKEIYWTGFTARKADQILTHLNKDTVWKRAGDEQRQFCYRQALAAIDAIHRLGRNLT